MAVNDSVDAAAKSVDEKIDATRESLGDSMGRMKERVGEVADNVKAKAQSLRDRIRDTEWDDVVENVTGYVRDNPGNALGVGFAMGFLLRHRDDD